MHIPQYSGINPDELDFSISQLKPSMHLPQSGALIARPQGSPTFFLISGKLDKNHAHGDCFSTITKRVTGYLYY